MGARVSVNMYVGLNVRTFATILLSDLQAPELHGAMQIFLGAGAVTFAGKWGPYSI